MAHLVTQKMSTWRQGDVADFKKFMHVADLTKPVTEISLKAASERQGSGLVNLTSSVEAIVLLTQTCDIVRNSDERSYIQVCPVLLVDQEKADQAASGELVRYAALPWYTSNAVADLDRMMTIEKGMLAGFEKLASWSHDLEIVKFQNSIVRRYERFAFPNEFNKGMSKLKKKITSRHGKPSSIEGVLFSKILQVRVEAELSWNAQSYTVLFHFILSSSDLQRLPEDLKPSNPLVDTQAWLSAKSRSSTDIAGRLRNETDTQAKSLLWSRLTEAWIQQSVESCGPFLGGTAAVTNDEEYSYADLKRSVNLDLDYLSTAE